MKFMTKIQSCCRGPKLNKDGGYAWVILISAFFTCSLTTGFILATVGNLTIFHKEFFNISDQQSSSIGSVCTGMFFLFGPVASVIVKFTKSRLLQIIGGSCMILGLGLSALSHKPWHAYLLYGLLTAIGGSCCYISTSRIVAVYFEKRKHLAFAVSGLGTYVGMMAWPLVSEYLLDILGYSKTMVILASAEILLVVAGVSYFENVSEERTEVKEIVFSATKTQQQVENPTDSSNCHVNNGFSSHDNGSDAEMQNKLRLSKEDAKILQHTTKEGSTEFMTEIASLLRSPKTWMLFVNFLLWQGNTSSYLILVNNYVLERTGASVEEVALGITILGIGNFVGCLGVVSVSGRTFDRMIIHFCCPLVFGVATIATAFISSKESFYACGFIWGMALSATIGNLLSMIHGLGRPEQFTLLLGVGFFGEGIGALCTTPLIGVISSASTDQGGIIFSGLLGICSSFTVLPLLILNARKRFLGLNKSSIEGQSAEAGKF